MIEALGTLTFLVTAVLMAAVMEKVIIPLPNWTGPVFAFLILPILYFVLAGAIVIIFTEGGI